MALFQPTNVIPSSFAGVGGDLIDAYDDMTISWQVNGTSPMTAYQITIYRNNASSYQLYTTGKVTLTEPFYGVDGMGNIQRYSVTLASVTLRNAGLSNGSADAYKFKITQWWSGGSVAQTAENYFICQTKPTVTLDTTEISGPTATLTGTYAQAEGVGLDWVRWIIQADGQTVEDSGKIHTQELSYTWDGFLDSTTYDITLEYQAQNGYQGSVSAQVPSSWTLLELRETYLSVSPMEGCIGAAISTPGIASGTLLEPTGTYGVSGGVLRITNTGYLEWVGDALSSGDTFVWRGPLQDGDQLNVEVGSQTGSGGSAIFKITSDSTKYYFTWTVGGRTVVNTEGPKARVYNQQPVTLIINKNSYMIRNYNGPAHSGTAYQYTFQSKTSGMYIKLTGKNSCAYLGVGKFGTMNSATENTLANTNQPTLDARWIYLSNWGENGVTNIGTTTGEATAVGSVLYRQDLNTGDIEKLCSLTSGSSVIDYGIKSGGLYSYMQVLSAGAVIRTGYDPGETTGRLQEATADYDISDGYLTITGSTGRLKWGGSIETAGDTLVWQGTITGGGAAIIVDTATGTGGHQYFYLSLQNGELNWSWADGSDPYEVGLLTGAYTGGLLMLVVNGGRFVLYYGQRKIADSQHTDITFQTTTDPAAIQLSGIQTCNYLGIGNFGTMTDDEISALAGTFQPGYDARWIYLSNWGERGVYTIGETTSGGNITPFAACFWNWIVDTGVWDEDRGAYEYTGSYIFALNVETDAFDNGNNPNLMTNFTRYPTRQGTSQNYLSGQLTGYIGHVDRENNVYIDTAAEAEAIRTLSTSTEAKFLRSRKGERWMIDTSGPIRLTLGDRYKEQPYTMSLPWAEVGDASGAALISLPGDAAWTDPQTEPVQSPYITINGVKYIPVSGGMGINGTNYSF